VAIVIPRRVWPSLLVWTLVGQIAAQSLPEGRGRETFRRICSNCHGLDVATKLRLPADQWAAIVDDMVNQGAQGTDDEFALITDYLKTNFSKANDDRDSKASTTQKINVNTASARQLTAVLEISNSDAEAIVQYRKEKGAFKDWPDLRKVPGIDLKKLEERKDRVVFTGTPG
jgi:competence protein ComEA